MTTVYEAPCLTDRQMAYHEAGHAIAALVRGLEVESATIRPARGYDGRVMVRGILAGDPANNVICFLSGAAATKRLTGRLTYSATDIASAKEWLSVGCNVPDARIEKALTVYATVASALVETHWSWIERTAAALLKCGTLDGRTIERLQKAHDERSI